MEGAGLPLGRHRGTHAILLSHRGVPGSAQRGPAAGLLGSRGHIQSGETEQSFIKGACVHCGQNARGRMLSCSPGPGPVLAQGGRGSGPQNRRGSGCLAEAAAVGRGRPDVEEAGDPSPPGLSGSPAALLMD